ncbi:uncharacterized protein PAC_11518 [Phialocephala subalpina]|uniref:C2H2-type domain-containing protein n=1 Tax=Phialocephala subalpina TaxID=576137 RepID=A0A1L7X9C2_9HELO|nr:uncharacterized protein PAC_11518 [Phialocephala subalpina]
MPQENAPEPGNQALIRVQCRWPGCNEDFTRKTDMERHYTTMHLQQNLYHCPIDGCQTKALRKDKLREHMVKRHGSGPEGYVNINAAQSSAPSTLQDSNSSMRSTFLRIETQITTETTTGNIGPRTSTELCEQSEEQPRYDRDLNTSIERPAPPLDYILRSQSSVGLVHITTTIDDDKATLDTQQTFAEWMTDNFDDSNISTWSF